MLLRNRMAFALSLIPLLSLTRLFSADQPAPRPTAKTPAELAAADFFRPLAIKTAKLNPAGTHMAFTVFEADVDSTGLRVYEFATGKTTGLRGTKARDLYDFDWAGDERIIYSVVEDNRYASGLYAVSLDKLDSPAICNRYDVATALSQPKARPGNIFVWSRMSWRERGGPGPLVELDLKHRYIAPFDQDPSQIVRSIRQPPGDSALGWLSDRSGEIRYGITQTKGKPKLYRRDKNDKWTEVNLDMDRFDTLAVDSDPNVLFVARYGSDGSRELVRFNTLDGTNGPVLYKDPKYDFGTGGLIFSGDDQSVVGLRYAKQAPVHIPLREDETALQAAVDAALPGEQINQIVSRSRDLSRVLVRSSTDRHPGSIYVVEPKTKSVTRVGDLAPWLPENLLGPVKVTSFTTRDGLRLDAYVTLPSDYNAGKSAPMIVLPHGDPWKRDVWGYDAKAQFFASRGYVVFQPNYRGSYGYNEEISVKPRAEFRKMHEDVTDGVRAMVKAGIADPAHIAIVGAYFGGYLAICGATYEPDIYRCAVTIAGVFDWTRFLKDASYNDGDSFRHDWFVRELGDPRTQREKFESISPILAASKIKIPVFIAHGEEDRNSESSQSHRLARILSQNGMPTETMFISDKGPGFNSLKNQVELYQRIESFLKKHL